MSLEKAQALVIRQYDFSETSRVVTLWTREFGKVRALAKGGRRLKSNFDSALDLLTVADIVLLRKTSGAMDLLTEARVRQRFGQLRKDLSALYAGTYLAELLGDWSEDYDPHPELFDESLRTLGDLGQAGVATGPRVARFELVLLRELGYGPALESCAGCGGEIRPGGATFSAAGGGVVCPRCQETFRDRRSLTTAGWNMLRRVQEEAEAWRELTDPVVRQEIRQVLNDYVTYVRGHQPRLLPYLGS